MRLFSRHLDINLDAAWKDRCCALQRRLDVAETTAHHHGERATQLEAVVESLRMQRDEARDAIARAVAERDWALDLLAAVSADLRAMVDEHPYSAREAGVATVLDRMRGAKR